ncbi:MAG TPA: cyclic pyranopterin monophosphate synthase MoaC [Stellaceae bacterium]|nr:cyclic pyranopterin monophosphate synthase MoaC [Stellaceae bacterium]
MSDFSHFDAQGRAVMVDLTDKAETDRVAVARGTVTMRPETLALIRSGGVKKGDVLSVARIAGIMGAKRTPDLVPLCHPVPLGSVEIDITLADAPPAVEIEAKCRLTGRTGVEMEALTAVAVAALTIYDMCKSVDRSMIIGEVRLVRKSGGRSGEWNAA